MIEVKPLHYFVAAYEEGSITAAASRCFISQPSITHAIKSLENSLNVVLFKRSKQGIKPTEEGQKLYKLATDMLLQNQHLEATFKPNSRVELLLYVQPDINIERYGAIIETIKHTSPFIDLSIVNTVEQAQLTIIDEQLLPSQFQFQPLNQESYRLVVQSDHPLANDDVVGLESFADLTFIERPYCTNRKAFARLLNEKNISITYKGKSIHDLQIQGLVKLGLGVAVIPESYIQKDNDLKYIAIVSDVPMTRSIVLGYRKLPSLVIETMEEISLRFQ